MYQDQYQESDHNYVLDWLYQTTIMSLDWLYTIRIRMLFRANSSRQWAVNLPIHMSILVIGYV